MIFSDVKPTEEGFYWLWVDEEPAPHLKLTIGQLFSSGKHLMWAFVGREDIVDHTLLKGVRYGPKIELKDERCS